MSTTADRWITFGAFGGYLILVILWENLHSLTLLVLHRFDFSVLRALPDWVLLFRMLKPGESYFRLLRAGSRLSGLNCTWATVPSSLSTGGWGW